jgi:hypothetical protein
MPPGKSRAKERRNSKTASPSPLLPGPKNITQMEELERLNAKWKQLWDSTNVQLNRWHIPGDEWVPRRQKTKTSPDNIQFSPDERWLLYEDNKWKEILLREDLCKTLQREWNQAGRRGINRFHTEFTSRYVGLPREDWRALHPLMPATSLQLAYEETEDGTAVDIDATIVGEPKISTKQKMKLQFSKMVGQVEKLEQVAAASQWMTSILSGPRDPLKLETFNAQMTKLGVEKILPDIIQYRMIGQISTYFLSGQRLRDGEQDDINALHELEISVCGWVRLASEGRLSRLEEFAEVENGEGRYNSVAERFKAFMDTYKRKGDYKGWTYSCMKDLRYDIYRVVHELDAETERPMLPSSECIVLFSTEIIHLLILGLARSNGDQLLRSTEVGRIFDEDRSRDSEEPSSSNNKRQQHSELSDEENLYNATPTPKHRFFSTSHPPAESSRAAAPTPNLGRHMVEQAEPVSRTRGTARRQSPETDDRNPAKFQKKLDALDKSMSAKRSTFEEAEEAVKAAQREYSTFSEKILKEVQDILKDCHAEGQEWTATAVRRQVDRFRRLGEVVRDALVPDLLVPLEEASETRSALEMAYIERAELTRKLEEAKRRS